MPDTTLPPADRIAIEDLLTALCRAVDAREPDRLGTLIADDVRFDLGRGMLEGRDSVVAAFRGRAEDLSYVARHTWSNLSIESIDGDEVRARHVFATFAHRDVDTSPKPVWRAGDCVDVIRRAANGGWLLQSRKMDAVMP